MTIYSRFILAVLFGLSVSHLFFTCLVMQSNTVLFASISELITAGYLTVPNSIVASHLQSFETAFYGAVFFTVTAGSFISILSAFLAVLAETLIKIKSALIIMGTVICIGVLLFNYNGLNPLITLVVVFVPLLTMGSFMILPENRTSEITMRPILLQAVSLVVLLLILMSVFMKSDKAIFIDFRDKLLLSSKAGQAINNYYYKYTLYPAEVIKTIRQKTLVPVFIDKNDKLVRRTEYILRNRDYLSILNQPHARIHVSLTEDTIRLTDPDRKKHVETPIREFYSDPDTVLKTFSQKTDTLGAFRFFILISLLTSFPLGVYLLIHYLVFLLAGGLVRFPKKGVRKMNGYFYWRLSRLAGGEMAYYFATAFVAIVAILFFVVMTWGTVTIASENQLRSYLRDTSADHRISALKYIGRNKKAYAHALIAYNPERIKGAGIAEKYWFANAAAGRADQYAQAIIGLLKDPQANVRCQALFALGRMDRHKSVTYLKETLATSDHWYVQWYAYRALKHTGWQQKPSLYKKKP